MDSQDPARRHHAAPGDEEHVATRRCRSSADAATYARDHTHNAVSGVVCLTLDVVYSVHNRTGDLLGVCRK